MKWSEIVMRNNYDIHAVPDKITAAEVSEMQQSCQLKVPLINFNGSLLYLNFLLSTHLTNLPWIGLDDKVDDIIKKILINLNKENMNSIILLCIYLSSNCNHIQNHTYIYR